MISPADIDALRANPRFLVRELVARGAEVELFDFQEQVFVVTLAGRREWLVDIESSVVRVPTAAIAGDKLLARRVLERAGISVPRGNRFLYTQINEALLYAKHLGFPVVVKPCRGRQGRGVAAGLSDFGEVEAAVDALCRGGERLFMLEEQVRGEELRVLITQRGAWACVRRSPAHVIGDGRSTIAALAAAETERRMSPRTTCLGPITLDEPWLRRSRRAPTDVPRAGELVFVRGCVESEGAGVEDRTDEVDPSIAVVAERVLAAFEGLPYAGIDLITQDARAEQTGEVYRVLEVNPNPALGLHIAPGTGRSRNAAAAIADVIFPETATPSAGLEKIR